MIRGVLAAGAAALIVGAVASATTGALAAPARQDVDNGRAAYASLGCPACHGDRAQGFVGPRLAGLTLSYEDALFQMREPTGGMPRYDAGLMSDEEFFDVYAYLRDLGGLQVNQTPAPPPPTHRPPARGMD